MSTTESNSLLQAYAERGDETAFRELVDRYADLVYSAALRRLNGNATEALDVTQTVFTDLARKARSVQNADCLGGWLYRHTGFVASTMVRTKQRRQLREREAAQMNAPDESTDTLWQELAGQLDASIDELDPTDRRAILLRFFERRDFRSVGTALGLTDDAAQKRVSRALDKLRELLLQRRVNLSAALLGTLLAGKAVSAAPAGLSALVSRNALAGAAVAGIGLGLGNLSISLWTKLSVGAIVLTAAVWLAVSYSSSFSAGPARQGIATATFETAAVEAVAAANVPVAAAQPSEGTKAPADRLVLTIVADDVSRPIPNVEFDFWVWEGESADRKRLRAARNGQCEVPFNRTRVKRLILASEIDGFVNTRLEWRPERGESIPQEYTLRLQRAVAIGGRVLDADGQPVEDAEVGFNNRPDISAETWPQCDNFGWPFWETARTDAKGEWAIHRIGKQALRTIDGSASHLEHGAADRLDVNRSPEAADQLLARNWTFKLGRAVVARGLVLDAAGTPVSEARILVGRVGESGRRTGKTSSDGSFAIKGCKPGTNILSAEADGFAATTLEADLSNDSSPISITLRTGAVLRLRVVDVNDAPIREASVWLDWIHDWHLPGTRPVTQVDFNRNTDSDGRLEWLSAPPDEELRLSVRAKGHMNREVFDTCFQFAPAAPKIFPEPARL
ncbi:MAG TPA: sigma-70 family RNA polymerase sigma factor [Verrucomicrobiae bacterium]|nr:sigma-70 family RNA polymerase sigma factor [Verrucomicrobiae bacterium]